MATNFTVDDTDLSMITYSDHGWFTAGSSNEFNSTTHGTRSTNCTATFRFHGTFVQAFGTLSQEGLLSAPDPVDTFFLDDGSPVTFSPTPPSSDPAYHQLMFQSPQLQEGNHTLIVNLTVENSWLWLDYFVYTDNVQTSSSAFPESTLTVAQTQSSSVAGTSASAPPQAGSESALSKTLSGGAIAGIVIGSLMCLALVLVGSLLWWRRRRKARKNDDRNWVPAVQPFTPYTFAIPSRGLSTVKSTTTSSPQPRSAAKASPVSRPTYHNIPPLPRRGDHSPPEDDSSRGFDGNRYTTMLNRDASLTVSSKTYVNEYSRPPSYVG